MGSNSVQAVETYHKAFRPSKTLEEPYAIVSVGVICMETDELAQRYHNAAYISTVCAMSGEPGPLLSPEEIDAAPDWPWAPAQDHFVSDVLSHHVVGSPTTVKAGLEDLAERAGANELMIATIMHGLRASTEVIRVGGGGVSDGEPGVVAVTRVPGFIGRHR
jgi:alkanesulfonate monooxygenase SsuD/methylene tetrahydromethanopterin reductase-like flavin-dependent oxidoreductase (luciferase family)